MTPTVRRSRRMVAAVAAYLLLCAAAAPAQSELVIHLEGTKLYHRAGCPVVKDGKGVMALTRAQAEARGLRAHADCDPAQQPTGQKDPSAKPAGPAPVVYLDGSRYYHRKSCKELGADPKSVKEASLEEAAKSHWPCPTCKPPIRQRPGGPAVPGTGRRGA